MTVSALAAALSVPWAIRPEALQTILDIAARVHEPDFETVAQRLSARHREINYDAVSVAQGTQLAGTRNVRMRGNVAVLPVTGSIFRYANLMSETSGATSVETMAKDFQTALNNVDVKSILLHVDSPGGEVNGIQEFSEQLYAARGKKPMWAYVSNEGASAAYWIASACDRIICAPTSLLGSIGVVAAIPDPSKESGRVQFVSSQSPNKRPDPTSEDGKAQIQTVIDDLASQFVDTVARNRSVSVDTVLSDFGAGFVMVGQKAVDAKLADAVGTFEQSLVEIARSASTSSESTTSTHAIASIPIQVKEDSSITQRESPRTEEVRNKKVLEKGHRSMGLKDRLLAAISGAPDEEFEADESAARSVVNNNAPSFPAAPPVASVAPAATAAELEIRQLREQLTRSEDEKRRLKAERMQERADEFWGRLLRDGQAVPAEQSGVIQGYIRSAIDDDILPLPDGSTRVEHFEAMYLARPNHMLMAEQVPSALNDLIMLKNNMTSLKSSTTALGQPMSESRRAELLKQTDLGQQVLAQRNASNNGNSRHN